MVRTLVDNLLHPEDSGSDMPEPGTATILIVAGATIVAAGALQQVGLRIADDLYDACRSEG